MSRVIVDASILIDHLRGRSADFKALEIGRLNDQLELLIPHVVIIELFAGQEARKRSVRELLDELLEGLEVVGLTVTSAKKAGELIRTYPQIPDPFDFIIAAVALEQEAQIATHNVKHFVQIPGVTLFDFSNN